MSLRVVRRLASWIALVALLAVAFMPTITQALSVRPDAAYLCAADAARRSAPSDGQHRLDHCPYCALHTDLAMPPPPSAAVADTPARFHERPAAFLRGPRASSIWSTSQPRAPPFSA